MPERLPSHCVPLPLIADVLNYIIVNPIYNIQDLRSFTDKSEPYIRSCLTICKLLKIINEDGELAPFVNELGKTPSNELKYKVIRKFIQEYEPFITFIQYHLNGSTLDDAARKVYVLYKFQGKDYLFLKGLFITWGETVGIFVNTEDKIILAETIRSEIVNIQTNDIDLDEDMAIRMYISDSLGADVFSDMSSIEIDELVDALKKYSHDARAAIECTGRAFEDFLRRTSSFLNIDVTRKSGIGQVINTLYNNKDSSGNMDNKIHSKQYAIGAAIGDIRNMAGHSLESRTMERWDLTSRTAKNYIKLVLATIRSIYIYTHDSRYTF